MKKALFIFLIFFFQFSFAQNANFQWAKELSGPYDEQGASIASDAQGNVYTAGTFSGTVDLDPNGGVYNLSSNGKMDIFISKLDAAGNFVWAKSIGSPYNDFGTGISLDASGNIFTTGWFYGTVDFDPSVGIDTISSNSVSSDIFVLKLDKNGNFVWAKVIGGASEDEGLSITADLAGNILTTGYFSGNADFDPGVSTYTLNASLTNAFVSKLDANGNFVWAKDLGDGGGFVRAYGIACDNSGNVYTTGKFTTTADFDPGPGIYNLVVSGGGRAGFVSKLNSSGNFVWAQKIGGNAYDSYAHSISVDSLHNVYTTGSFNGTIDFDSGPGYDTLSWYGGEETFILKLDSIGNHVWAKGLNGGDGRGNSIVNDKYNNVYITGSWGGVVDFNPNAGIDTISQWYGSGVFILKLDGGGNFSYVKAIIGPGGGDGLGINIDIQNNIYTTGWFAGTLDCDPGVGTFNLTSIANSDAFVHKMNQSFVGLQEVEKSANNIYAYPNPSADYLILKSEIKNIENSEIEITNTIGQTVLKLAYSNSINVSKLEQGCYYLKISSSTHMTYYSKFIKQ